ncbi:MAG TPA: chemotaxis protein CheW [Gammaproteobacteria bacterium]|nr:chemotaxis protein CheW [Gammaproteobacteria bacterium]
MSESSHGSPLEWLVHLESLCLKHASGLPQREENDDEWVGIGFRLGDLRLVAPLGEVAEILTPPGLSRVPRTKAWVCGIANVRGNLLPIMDLQGYLHDRPASINRRSRVLVVSHGGVYSGLVVDAVLGLRHFRPEQRCEDLPGSDARIQRYMTHGFRTGSEHWGVFSMFSLAETPEFLQAAV